MDEISYEESYVPIKLLKNGLQKKKLYEENRQENKIETAKLDIHKYPRSQEPIALMRMYSNSELKSVIPRHILTEFHKKQVEWDKKKADALVYGTPLNRGVRELVFSVVLSK